MKRCNKCKHNYKSTKKNFYKDKIVKCGFRGICKKCEKENKNNWIDRQSPNKISEIKRKQKEAILLYRQTPQHKIMTEAYKKRRNMLNRQRTIERNKIEGAILHHRTHDKLMRNLQSYQDRLNWEAPATKSYKDLIIW